MMSSVFLQVDEIVGLLENPGFVWALLLGTWGAISLSFLRRHRGGPKVGPTPVSHAGAASFSLKPRMSEEDVFRILTTDETNIQIVRICENPRSAREVARGLGEVYPGHKDKGFPADKLGEHLANLEKLGAVKFNGEKWSATDVGVKMVRKYFG